MKCFRPFAAVAFAIAAFATMPARAISPEYFQLLNETQGFLTVLSGAVTRGPVCTPQEITEGQGAILRAIGSSAFKQVVIEPLEAGAKVALGAAGAPAAVLTTYGMARCAMDAADASAWTRCALGEAINFRGTEVLKELGVQNLEQAIAGYAWDQGYAAMLGALNQYQAAPEQYDFTESGGCTNVVASQWTKRRQPGAEGGTIVLSVRTSNCPCRTPSALDHGTMRMVVPVRLVRTGNNQPGWAAGSPREIPITVACCSAPSGETSIGVMPGGEVKFPKDEVPVTAPPRPPRTPTTGGLGSGSGAGAGTAGSSGSSGSGNAIAIPGGAPRRPGTPGGPPVTIGGGTSSGAGAPAAGQRWSVDKPCPACQKIAADLKAAVAEVERLKPLLEKARDDLEKVRADIPGAQKQVTALQSQLNAMAGTGGESVDPATGVRIESYVQPDGTVRVRTFDRTGKVTDEYTRPYETANKVRADLAAAQAKLDALNAKVPGLTRDVTRLDDEFHSASVKAQGLRIELANCVETKCRGGAGGEGTVGVVPGTGSDDHLWYNPDRPAPTTGTGDRELWYDPQRGKPPVAPAGKAPAADGPKDAAAVPGATAPVASGPQSPADPTCPCKEALAKLRYHERLADLARRQLEQSRDAVDRAFVVHSELFAVIRGADPNATYEKFRTSPPAVEAWAKYLSAKDVAEDAESRLRAANVDVMFARKAHEDCLKRCGVLEPRLDIAINTGGNNPFDPRNPMGGKPVTGGGTPPPAGAIGSIQLSNASYAGGEGGAVLITVLRVGGRRGNVSVGYATSSGTATAGADFTAANGTLSWADGDDTPKSFSIALTDDTQQESTETFTVTLSNFGGGATAGSPTTATVSITDNDGPVVPLPAGTLQFSIPTYETAESAGAVTITVTRTGGSNGAVGVQYFTGPSSATAGSDYQAVSGSLQWANGDTGSKTFTVPIIDDTLVEGPETFFVTLNSPTGGATLGNPATATVSIQDNDVATGPCGAQGNAWQPNSGAPYSCFGSCSPNANAPVVSISGDIVTVTNFHAGGAATFQGCSASINSQSSTLVYFGQANHRATITRTSNSAFSANIVSSGGGTCAFTCSR